MTKVVDLTNVTKTTLSDIAKLPDIMTGDSFEVDFYDHREANDEPVVKDERLGLLLISCNLNFDKLLGIPNFARKAIKIGTMTFTDDRELNGMRSIADKPRRTLVARVIDMQGKVAVQMDAMDCYLKVASMKLNSERSKFFRYTVNVYRHR